MKLWVMADEHLTVVSLKNARFLLQSRAPVSTRPTVAARNGRVQDPLGADVDRLYRCAFCPLSFPSWRRCQRHQAQHRPNAANLRCAQCQVTCAGVQALIAHTAARHAGSGQMLCKVCGKLFEKKRYLQQHAVMHDKPRYQCHQCGRCFQWRGCRNSHAKTCVGK